MQRRSFIRVLGGGVIFAAGTSATTLSAHAQSMPPESIVDWRGPSAGEPDARRWALGYAILAPNPHNRQPWLVDLREPDVITLHCDGQRLLPETDPFGRQILIGHGCFLELLSIALAQKGWVAQIETFPKGAPGTNLAELGQYPVARISLKPSATPDPLFSQILLRHTPKAEFDTQRPIAPELLQALSSVSNLPNFKFGHTVDPTRVQTLRTLCQAAARTEIDTERTMMESMRLLRVGPDEINQHRDGISNNAMMVRLLAATGLWNRSEFPKPGSSVHGQTVARFEAMSSTAMGFVWFSTPDNKRSTQIQSGRTYVRLQLAATQAGFGMHPMSQALQEFPEMQAHYDQVHRLLLDRPAPRSVDEPTLQMLVRVGYPVAPAQATPRRGVAALIKS